MAMIPPSLAFRSEATRTTSRNVAQVDDFYIFPKELPGRHLVKN